MFRFWIPILAIYSTATAFPGFPGQNCPEGFSSASVFSSGPNCYKTITGNPLPWDAAKSFCEDLDAKLFLPTTFMENSDVWRSYEGRSDADGTFWIDVVALDESNPLRYTSSEGQALNFTSWEIPNIWNDTGSDGSSEDVITPLLPGTFEPRTQNGAAFVKTYPDVSQTFKKEKKC